MTITITPRGLGRGPSAGLAFTLEVYDALSGHHLANGRKIAVTGTMDLAANVGPIGGVRQKVLGACAAARHRARSRLPTPRTPARPPTDASR